MTPLLYLSQIEQGKSPSDYAAKMCYHPKFVWVFDSITGTRVKRSVDCGKCLYCQDKKRNEMASRMFLHMLDYEYRYFVTLTYGTYNLNLYKAHPFKEDWLKTFPVCDSFNKSRKPAWTPVLLIQEHVQKFFKRLRKNTNANFTYVCAGELGETYSRPHHHIIIYSHQPLSRLDIQHAWSYRCVHTPDKYVIKQFNGRTKQKPYWFNIGKVDFVDLNENGSCDWKCTDKNLRGGNNALHCFNYVAKYICKPKCDLSSFALNRLLRTYDKLQTSLDFNVKVGTMTIDKLRPGAFGDFCMYGKTQIDTYIDEDTFQKQLELYELYKNFNKLNEFTNIQNPKNYETKIVHINGRTLMDCDFNTFLSLFTHYFSFSRSTPIGSLYFEKECARFESGNFALPKPFGQTLEFPTYFYTLLARKQSSFFFRKTTLLSNTLVKGSLPLVRRFFSAFRENKIAYYDITFRLQNPLFPCQNTESKPISGLLDRYPEHGNMLAITMYDSTKRVHYYYDVTTDSFNGYVFNKHAREYDLFDVISRIDMCDYILDNIEILNNKNADICKRRFERNKLSELISMHEDSENTINQYLLRRKRNNEEYNCKHFTKDSL